MGGITRAAAALITLVLGMAAAAAPAGAGSEPLTLVVGIDGPAASAALAAAGAEVIDVVEPIGVVEVQVPAAAAAAAMRGLERAPGIRFVEPEYQVQADLVPTDTYWSHQWGPRTVSAPEAWDTTTGASSVVIAVLDTGVTAGPEFDGKLTAGTDLVNDDDDPTDDNGHGTAAAAVAAADANDLGVAGLCWTCRVMPVKVLDDQGAGGTAAIAQGITWAADHGADVINMSFGGTSSSRAVADAVAYARSKGAVLIAAAGNEGVTTVNYPAGHTGVLAVAASTSTDTRYSWSNHGSWVDVAAPGCNGAPLGDGYGDFCGTSSAAPLVAGIAALGLALDAPASVVEDALLSSAVPVGSWVSHGRVDASGTIDAVVTALASVTDPVEDEPVDDDSETTEPMPDDSTTVAISRVAGDSRIDTSAALARRAFPDGATTVVLARADAYADALAAAPMAAGLGGPVLLTSGTTLSPAVADVIDHLGATAAVLVGGTGALSDAVSDGLEAIGVRDVSRISGANRFDTARLIAEKVGGTSVYVVEGANADPKRGWPDAVAVSSLASLQGRPILLTTAAALPSETSEALSGRSSATIVGGTNAVSEAVEHELATTVTVTRVAGATRYDTSAGLAEAAAKAGADDGHVWVATGRSWPDALAAGPAAAAVGAVLLLVDGTDIDLSPESIAWLEQRSSLHDVVLVGGTASVSSAVESDITALAN